MALLSSHLNLSQALLSSVNTDFIFEKHNPLLHFLQFTKAEMTSFFDSNWTFPWRLPLGLSRKEVKHTRDHTAERSRATLFYSKRGKKGGGGAFQFKSEC